MACTSCKGFNIIIENHNKDFLLEAKLSNKGNPYVNKIIESASTYPKLKNALNTAFANIQTTTNNQLRINPADVRRAFEESLKVNAEAGFQKVIGKDGKDFINHVLSNSQQSAPKLPRNKKSNKAKKTAMEYTQLSFIGAYYAQSYIDYLFRVALPAESINKILLPIAAKAVKTLPKITSESKNKKFKIIIENELKELWAPIADRPVKKLTKEDWHLVLDIVGTIDPFGVADGANIILYYNDYVSAINNPSLDGGLQKQNEALVGALGSFIGLVIPYAGDVAKFGIKGGVKLTKFVKDVQPLILKLEKNIATSTGLKKKFYEGILNLLKESPEQIAKNVNKAQKLKPAGLAAARTASQKAISNFFFKRLQKVTAGSTAFQLAIFALLKTETFGPIAAYIFALPLASAQLIIDGFVSFVETTTIKSWKADLEKQQWLKEHPALRTMIKDYLDSTEFKRALENLEKSFKKKELEKEKERRNDAIGDAYSTMQENKDNSDLIRIIIENKKLEEKKLPFSRLDLTRATKRIGDLIGSGNFRIANLLDTASPVYKAYRQAMDRIDDSITGRALYTIKNADVKSSITTLLDTLQGQVSTALNQVTKNLKRLNKIKNNSELITKPDGTTAYKLKKPLKLTDDAPKKAAKGTEILASEIDGRIATLEAQEKGLLARKEEIRYRQNRLTEDPKTRRAAYEKGNVPEVPVEYRSWIEKSLRATAPVAITSAAFYGVAYPACRVATPTATFLATLNLIKENPFSKAFFTIIAGVLSTAGLSASLVAAVTKAEGWLKTMGAYGSYAVRVLAAISGCWDGAIASGATNLQAAIESSGVASNFNDMVSRLKEQEGLSDDQVKLMKIGLADDSFWSYIEEVITPSSTTRGSVADSIINDYGALDLIQTSFELPSPTDPKEIKTWATKTLKRKYFIPQNVTLFLVELYRVLERNRVKDKNMQRAIILCILGDWIEQTLKSFPAEGLKDGATSLYIFLFQEVPEDDAIAKDFSFIKEEIKKKFNKKLETAFRQMSNQLSLYIAKGIKTAESISKNNGLFAGSDAQIYVALLRNYLKLSDQDKADPKINKKLNERLNELETNIQTKIDKHEKALEGTLSEGLTQYHQVHLDYYQAILAKLKEGRKKLDSAGNPQSLKDLGLTDNFSPFSPSLKKDGKEIADCETLYNIYKEAYDKLRYIVFNKMTQETKKVEKAVEDLKKDPNIEKKDLPAGIANLPQEQIDKLNKLGLTNE